MVLAEGLSRIGFTEYEAKVYLALLQESPATGYQISKISGVPRSMVYDALTRLHGRGAVLESLEGRATLYRPLPPDLLLERHHDEHLCLMEGLRAGLRKLFNTVEEERVWSLVGSRPTHTYAGQMIAAAQKELYLVLGDEDLVALRPPLAAAVQRAVALHVLVTGASRLDFGQVAYHPPLESELHGLTGMLLIVADQAEVLIAGRDRAAPTTITRNANLVAIARQFVWMEFFTGRLYTRLGPELLDRLEPQDRRIFESLKEAGREQHLPGEQPNH
jgi:Cd2+/Zn2+-exporting ATPase